MKKIIFNADDFGFSKKINLGILKAFKKGVITDSSLIMTMPGTSHAISLIKKHKLNAGIHLNLTEGKPLSKNNNSIIRNHKYLKTNTILIKALANRLKKEDIKQELRLQIDKFFESGLKPTHIDTHQYLDMIPIIFESVAEVSKEYNISKIRIPDESPHSNYHSVGKSFLYFLKPQFFKSILVSKFSRKSRKKIKKYGLKTTDHFYGIARISSSGVLNSFNHIINHIKQGTTEIMCHPGFYDSNIKKISFYHKQREMELNALTSESIKKNIKSNKIKLISFKDL